MIVKIYSVFCDERVVCVGDWIAQTESVTSARREAKRAGWGRDGGLDICPACVAALDEERGAS